LEVTTQLILSLLGASFLGGVFFCMLLEGEASLEIAEGWELEPSPNSIASRLKKKRPIMSNITILVILVAIIIIFLSYLLVTLPGLFSNIVSLVAFSVVLFLAFVVFFLGFLFLFFVPFSAHL
jgi:sterol desaturase/sphingolipid hydroxylase (fatty acid hydroxylase superfamily)